MHKNARVIQTAEHRVSFSGFGLAECQNGPIDAVKSIINDRLNKNVKDIFSDFSSNIRLNIVDDLADMPMHWKAVLAAKQPEHTWFLCCVLRIPFLKENRVKITWK